MILNFILAHAKTYAKINQPTTDMSIVISTAAVTEKRSNFLTLFDTNDATDYTIVEVQRNRGFLQVWLQTSASIGPRKMLLKKSKHGIHVVRNIEDLVVSYWNDQGSNFPTRCFPTTYKLETCLKP